MSDARPEQAAGAVDVATVEALLAAAEAAPGKWRASGGTMPNYLYSENTRRLLAALHDCSLPLACDCTSPKYLTHIYGQEPQRVAAADLPTLRRLIFCHLRADRFVEGHLAQALTSGQFGRIVRRALRLLSGSATDCGNTTAVEV